MHDILRENYVTLIPSDPGNFIPSLTRYAPIGERPVLTKGDIQPGPANGACWSAAVGAGFRIVVGNGLAAYGKAWAIAAAPKAMVKRETSAGYVNGLAAA